MDGISWTDLDEDEQRVIAMLMEGASADRRAGRAPHVETRRLSERLPIDAGGTLCRGLARHSLR